MKKFNFKNILLFIMVGILVACGGTDEITEKMDEMKDVVQEKMESDTEDV